MQLKYSVKQNKSVSEELLSEMVGILSFIMTHTIRYCLEKLLANALWKVVK